MKNVIKIKYKNESEVSLLSRTSPVVESRLLIESTHLVNLSCCAVTCCPSESAKLCETEKINIIQSSSYSSDERKCNDNIRGIFS